MATAFEKTYVDYIRYKFPGFTARTNDRTIIPSRDSGNNLEIDLYMPHLKLGFEFNGESYHDHEQYKRDKENGTEYSEEMYKENYCKKNGIKLVHIWSSESEGDNKYIIQREVNEARERVKVSKESSNESSSKSYDDYKVVLGVILFLVLLLLPAACGTASRL